MKKNLTIVTFISKNEKLNKDIDDLIIFLSKHYKIETLIFSDKNERVKSSYNLFVKSNETKYKRILFAITKSKNSNILCIDNDITTNKDNLQQFISNCFDKNYALSWGKIKAKNPNNLVSHLISIDKNLSHDIVRPLSWNLKIGISLPGQIFMINKEYFIEKLPSTDTVYDDLEIGLITKKYNMPIFFENNVLGCEEPKRNFKDLIEQRKRWAKGYAQVLHNNNDNKLTKYIIIHGIIYNLLWIPINTMLLFLCFISLKYFIILFLALSVILSSKKVKDFLWSILYILLFWIVYIIWLVQLIKEFKIINNMNKSI